MNFVLAMKPSPGAGAADGVGAGEQHAADLLQLHVRDVGNVAGDDFRAARIEHADHARTGAGDEVLVRHRIDARLLEPDLEEQRRCGLHAADDDFLADDVLGALDGALRRRRR